MASGRGSGTVPLVFPMGRPGLHGGRPGLAPPLVEYPGALPGPGPYAIDGGWFFWGVHSRLCRNCWTQAFGRGTLLPGVHRVLGSTPCGYGRRIRGGGGGPRKWVVPPSVGDICCQADSGNPAANRRATPWHCTRGFWFGLRFNGSANECWIIPTRSRLHLVEFAAVVVLPGLSLVPDPGGRAVLGTQIFRGAELSRISGVGSIGSTGVVAKGVLGLGSWLGVGGDVCLGKHGVGEVWEPAKDARGGGPSMAGTSIAPVRSVGQSIRALSPGRLRAGPTGFSWSGCVSAVPHRHAAFCADGRIRAGHVDCRDACGVGPQ